MARARVVSTDRFHYTDEQATRSIKKHLDTAVSNGTMSHDDARLIMAFVDAKRSAGIATSTVHRYVRLLISFRKFLRCDFKDATKADLSSAKVAIENAVDGDGEPLYAQNTCKDLLDVAKMLYRWGLEDDEGQPWSKISESQIKKIKSMGANHKSKKIDDIMTADEVQRLIAAADNARDRAILAVQYECALRAVEIGRLRWRDITSKNEVESSVSVREKTGKERNVSIVLYNAFLTQWKRDATNSGEPNGYVFLTHGRNARGRQIHYNSVRAIIKQCGDRAGITGRKITPHTLRHSRITYWLQHNVSIAKVCMMAWGEPYSDQIKTYAHLGIDDQAREQRRLAGLPEDVRQVGSLELLVCPRCERQNPPGTVYCGWCGAGLTEIAIAQKEKDHQAANLVLETLLKRVEALEKGKATK